MKNSQNDARTTADVVEEILEGIVETGIKVAYPTRRPLIGTGDRRSRYTGDNGYDIVGYEEAAPGDRVDGRASARTRWQTKLKAVYEEPRDLHIVVLIDAATPLVFGTQGMSEGELAAHLMGKILGAADRDDLSSVVIYDDDNIRNVLRPQGVRSQLVPALYTYLDPEYSDLFEPDPDDERSGLEQALSHLPANEHCQVWVISPFQKMDAGQLDEMTTQAEIHDVICLIVKDPRERELPEGYGILQMRDLSTGKLASVWLNDRNRKQWTAEYDAFTNKLHQRLKDAEVSFEDFSTAMSSDEINELLMPLLSGNRNME